MNLERLRYKVKTGQYFISRHAQKRLDERNITNDELLKVIFEGEIIEDYPDDKPYPSCLMIKYVRENEPLYVVCAVNEFGIYYYCTLD